LYDKGMMHTPRPWIVALPQKKKEQDFISINPHAEPYLKAFKYRRSMIERVFGIMVTKWSILQKAYKGRGPNKYLRLGQIVLICAQLTNLVFMFEKITKNKKNMVNKNPPSNFAEMLAKFLNC